MCAYVHMESNDSEEPLHIPPMIQYSLERLQQIQLSETFLLKLTVRS